MFSINFFIFFIDLYNFIKIINIVKLRESAIKRRDAFKKTWYILYLKILYLYYILPSVKHFIGKHNVQLLTILFFLITLIMFAPRQKNVTSEVFCLNVLKSHIAQNINEWSLYKCSDKDISSPSWVMPACDSSEGIMMVGYRCGLSGLGLDCKMLACPLQVESWLMGPEWRPGFLES